MQRHGYDGHALLLYLFQQLGGEVQSGGWRGSGALVLGVDGLVTAAILQLFVDVGRQGHLAQLVEDFLEYAVIHKTDNTAADFRHAGHDFTLQQPVAKGAHRAWLEAAARLDQGLPVGGVFAAQQQDLHRHLGAVGICGFLHAQKARGDHLRLVDNQRVAGIEVIQNVVKMLVLTGAVPPVHHHQSGVIAGLHGGLGDELFRQEIIKISGTH